MAKKSASSASATPSIDLSIFDGKGAKVVASISLDGSIDTQKDQQKPPCVGVTKCVSDNVGRPTKI